VEREWKQKSPQISGATIDLLDEQGRVWVSIDHRKRLLGYDGQQWIERNGRSGGVFVGRCPTKGQLTDVGANQSRNDVSWFIEQTGIHRFHNKSWTYHPVPNSKYQNYPELAVSPDGRIGVAYRSSAEGLLAFKDGQWSLHQKANATKSRAMSYGVVTNEGQFHFLENGRIWGYDLIKQTDIFDRSSFRVGRIEVSTPFAMFQDSAGRLYVPGALIRERTREEPGAAFRHPDGKAAAIFENKLTSAWFTDHGPPPILSPSADKLWVPSQERGACLLDLERKTIVDEIPILSASVQLQAVDEEGNVYFGEAMLGGPAPMVYRPGVPDARPPLDVSTLEVPTLGGLLVTDDGSVWAVRKDNMLVRFDGKEWQPIVSGTNYCVLRAGGHDGIVLVGADRKLFLCKKNRVIAEGGYNGPGDCVSFIKDHKDIFAPAFGPKYRDLDFPGERGRPLYIYTDLRGNMWVRENSQLYVLHNERLISAAGDLQKAGAQWTKSIAFHAPVGKGDEIYVSDLADDRGKSFLGTAKNGVLQFREAPHARWSHLAPTGIYDLKDNLWIKTRVARRGNDSPVPLEVATCLSAPQVSRSFENIGWPLFVDAAGNVWLGHVFRFAHFFTLVDEKGIAQKLDLPEGDVVHGLVSDRPGSVYAWTPQGLVHLVSKGPRFNEYGIVHVYSLPGVSGELRHIRYSKHGYIAAITESNHTLLHLISLPNAGERK